MMSRRHPIWRSPMNLRLVAFAALLICHQLMAQTSDLPPVRRLAAPVATSGKVFHSVTSIRVLPGGRLLVNDVGAHRLSILDTMFAVVRVVADTDPASATPYGGRPGGLIPLRGDSSVFVEMQTPAMYLIDPT